jgi:integrase
MWKLDAPRPRRSPNWYIRGTYLGIALDRSTGTRDRQAAARILATWKKQAERGEFSQPGKDNAELFLSAAKAYLLAGGEGKFVRPICEKWSAKATADIDQVAIDTLAQELYPTATAATRNRQIYTPVSAILKHVGIEKKINRPKGWRGNKRTTWMNPDDTFRLLAAATELDPELGILCTLLNYTGMRLSEALGLMCDKVELARDFAYIPDTKTGEPRAVYLPPVAVAALANHPRGLDRNGPVFDFRNGSSLRNMFVAACKAAGVVLPDRTAFHVFRHNYGTWMRLYGGLDGIGLTRTGAWADLDSVERYAHSESTAEARRAVLLPTPICAENGRNIHSQPEMFAARS